MHTSSRFTGFLFPLAALAVAACATQPNIATDVTYCCDTGARNAATFRIVFEDMPEFLKPMLRDEAAIVLHAKGLDYTEGDAHTVLRMTFVDRTFEEEQERDIAAWERVAPGGGVRFIAEVQLELLDAVTRQRILAGTMRRVHNVYEGSYMHDAPARSAMRQAFLHLFADYPAPGPQ